MALPDSVQQMLDTYRASGGANGIPNELYRYAQDHPEAGIDRSGNALSVSDPLFSFYNPKPMKTPGVDWFPTDDRNFPAPDVATDSSVVPIAGHKDPVQTYAPGTPGTGDATGPFNQAKTPGLLNQPGLNAGVAAPSAVVALGVLALLLWAMES